MMLDEVSLLSLNEAVTHRPFFDLVLDAVARVPYLRSCSRLDEIWICFVVAVTRSIVLFLYL